MALHDSHADDRSELGERIVIGHSITSIIIGGYVQPYLEIKYSIYLVNCNNTFERNNDTLIDSGFRG